MISIVNYSLLEKMMSKVLVLVLKNLIKISKNNYDFMYFIDELYNVFNNVEF